MRNTQINYNIHQEKKKSIIIGTWFYDDQPGFHDFRYRIESLSQHFDVTLVLRANHFRKEFPGLNAKIVVLDSMPDRKSMLQFIWKLSKLAKSEKFDLLYLLGSQLAYCTFFIGNCPSILYWNEHPSHFFIGSRRRPDVVLLGKLMVSLSYAAARRASMLMPIGEAHRDDLLDHGASLKRVNMIYMGVEDRFSKMRTNLTPLNSDSPITVIYTGTVSAERGRDIMLEGLAHARKHGANIYMIIVGASNEELEYCNSRAIQLEISTALKVVGRVPGSEIPSYLAKAQLGVCLWADKIWWRFNPPTKLFEYLVAGLPVLGSRIRTHTEYVRDGFNGHIFDYNSDSFGEALIRVWSERHSIDSLSENAAKDGLRFIWSKIQTQFIEAVRSVMTTRKSSQNIHG